MTEEKMEKWSKQNKVFCDELDAVPGYKEWENNSWARERNRIAYMVNCKVPKEEADFKNEFEEAWYDYLWKVAELHVDVFGDWPVFEMEEIEYDDPYLDAYGEENSAEKWAADRKKRREAGTLK